ncbi:hypothetical protein DPM19_24735 [Actinomadura craniellae]|uniref:DUF3558 domain-containing protein n=1 Tax=Actinomadura craniellae TaxID=2231787 RepID=A0A365GZW4_9ACTN|nr:hypothetical protein [Actinomadura craniellae]RAY12361.1 hypothetical protein DPM19_24735 [Actinomadura craniellae]
MGPWHRTTGSLLALICVLIPSAGCFSGTPGAAPVTPGARRTPPAPDLCAKIDQKVVTAALRGKADRCAGAPGKSVFTVTFTGTARLSAERIPAVLTVSYALRRDPESGEDLWRIAGGTGGDRVTLFGVGDDAVFNARAEPQPQLVTVKGDLMVAVGLDFTGRDVPQAGLPDRLMEVARQALAAT